MEPDISPSLQASQQSCKSKNVVLVNTVVLLLHLVFMSEVLYNGKSWFGLQVCWYDTLLYSVSFLQLGWPPNQDSPMVLQLNPVNWSTFERNSETKLSCYWIWISLMAIRLNIHHCTLSNSNLPLKFSFTYWWQAGLWSKYRNWAMHWRPRNCGLFHGRGKRLKSYLMPTQSPTEWALVALSQKIKEPGREADTHANHLPV